MKRRSLNRMELLAIFGLVLLRADMAKGLASSGGPVHPSITRASSQNSEVRQQAKYDLGLGKYPPVLNSNSNNKKKILGGMEDDIHRVTRHWIDHEAVRSIPSPLDSPPHDHQHHHQRLSVTNNNKSNNKQKPKLQYHRQSEDVLFIYEPVASATKQSHDQPAQQKSTSTSRLQRKTPTMVANTQGAQLDMNTPWVEMLLHSEKVKAFEKKAAKEQQSATTARTSR